MATKSLYHVLAWLDVQLFQSTNLFANCFEISGNAMAWFSYIVIHRRCPCGLIVGGQRWIKSFVSERYMKTRLKRARVDDRRPRKQQNLIAFRPSTIDLYNHAFKIKFWSHRRHIGFLDPAIFAGVRVKKYKTFSVLIYSYINTSGNWKNEKLCGNTTPPGRVFSHNFEFFQFSRVLI